MIEIRPFDPGAARGTEWAAVHAFRRIRAEEDLPGEPVLDDAEFERELREVWPLYEFRRWYAWLGDEIVGVVGASFRRTGTADYEVHAPYVYGWCGVQAALRRRGVATKLLRPFLDFMRDRNKTIATFDTTNSDGDAFLAAIGAVLKLRQIENRAPFGAMDWAMLARWHDAAIPTDAPLRWEVHAGRVPRHRMEALIPQIAPLQADVPLDELDSPPIRHDLSAWLSWYDELNRHGGDHMLVLLTEGDEIAAVCEASWDARFPDRVYQLLTAVARRWRGRGLAKGVKAAMMLLIRDLHPDIRFVTTSNASLNAPMLPINTKLGFAEHKRTALYQIGFPALADYLARHPAAAGESA
jgi:RimJ/RimL family protein N-acetyltransferase